MNNNIITILKELNKIIEKTEYKKGFKEKYLKKINDLINIYSSLEINEIYNNTYEDLLKEGLLLKRNENYLIRKKMENFLSLAYRDYYEFKGEIKKINYSLAGSYVVTCALFLIVSSQMFPKLIVFLFLPAMYIGMRGLRNRNYTSFIIGTSVMEMSFLTSIIAIITILSAFKKYDAFIESLSKSYRNSTQFAEYVIIGLIVLSIIMLISSLYNIVLGYKYKKIYS